MGGAIQTAITPTGAVTTYAGSAGTSGATDGTGIAARFYNPSSVTTDGTNLYVADSGNSTIRKVVIATGAVTTLAGGVRGPTDVGSVDGTGMAATFNCPAGITTDGTNLYVTDYNLHTIRKIVIVTGVVTTLAGSANVWGTTDGTGTAARFKQPLGITTDGTNLYVEDNGQYHSAIRKIVIATGEVTTLAGSTNASSTLGSTDGTGTAAVLGVGVDITTDGTSLYVADQSNHTIRKIQ